MASTGSLLTTSLHCEGILQVLSGTGEVFLCKVYSVPSSSYLLLQIKHQGIFFFGLPPCCSLPPSRLFGSYRINGFRSSFGSQGAIRASRGAGHDEGRGQTGWQPPQPLLPCHVHRSCDCWIFDFWILNEAFTVSKLTLTCAVAVAVHNAWWLNDAATISILGINVSAILNCCKCVVLTSIWLVNMI